MNKYKTISVKELRMNFPKVRKELKKGVSYTIIYRSEPIGMLTPLSIGENPFALDSDENEEIGLPKDINDFVNNIDKYSFKKGKAFNAAELIRKDRKDDN